MARTTLAIEEHLLRQLKQRAALRGSSLQSLVNDLLRQALATHAKAPFRLRLGSFDAVQNPNVDITDRNSLFDAMDGH